MKLSIPTLFLFALLLCQATHAMEHTVYEQQHANYSKTIEFWRNKTINANKATLPPLIIHSNQNNYGVVSQRITKIFCKDSCFDTVSNCFCVQRSYHIERTVNTRGWNESEKIYSNLPQNDRFDIKKNSSEPIDIMQKTPCEFSEIFKAGLHEAILNICVQHGAPLIPILHGDIIWSPDYLRVAFVVMGKTEDSEDHIIVMTPIHEYPISPTRGTDAHFNFE